MAPDLDMVYGNLIQPPLSPTLTNPDMILPDAYDYGHSPPVKYQHTVHDQNDYDYASPLGPVVTLQGRRMNGNGIRPRSPSLLRLARPLSDIQEVETSQTTPKAQLLPYQTDGLASSPTLQDNIDVTRWDTIKTRRTSDDSSSVHSDDLENMKWPGFDSGGDVEDGSVVLDEEEEKFGSFPKVVGSDDGTDADNDQWLGAKTEDDKENNGDQDTLFQDPLSRRADIILANAKKRLNAMEGNLRGARSSLHINTTARPLSAMNSFNGTLRERFTTRTSLGHRPRQFSPSPLSSISTPGHSRIASETSVPSPVPSIPAPLPPSTHQKRSSSAMGSFMGGYNTLDRSASLRGVKSQEVIRDSRVHEWIMRELPHSAGLVPHFPTSDMSERSITPSQDRNGLSRSSSATGNLRAQMDELKGKISSLRERAREENLRRQSLNSLRTPSPFTAAENWYHGAETYKGQAWTTDAGVGWSPNSSPVAQGAPTGLDVLQHKVKHDHHHEPKTASSQSQDTPSDYQESNYEDAEASLEYNKASSEKNHIPTASSSTLSTDRAYNVDDDFREEKVLMGPDDPALDEVASIRRAKPEPELGHEHEPQLGQQGEVTDEGFEDGSVSGHSEYFEASSVVAERHEDRADAFDYEHFYLHSAMGTLRRASMSSEESVETTRPVSPKHPTTVIQNLSPNMAEQSPGLHRRSQSVETISTVASFQTATEGHDSDKNSEGDEATNNPLDTITQQIINNNVPARRADILSSVKVPRIGSPARPSSKRSSERPITPMTPTTTARNMLQIHSPGFALASTFLENDSISGPSEQLQQDRALVASLLASLQQACRKMQSQPTDAYERRVWRRRLDAARRALDGEIVEETLKSS